MFRAQRRSPLGAASGSLARRAWTRASPDRLARGMFAPRMAVAARARQRTEHTFAGRERSAAPSGCRRGPRRCWVGGFDEGLIGVCSVRLLSARPVSPLGYGMLCLHDASCTMSADVVCHNPPIPCKGGMDALLRPHTSEPAISREALPCAVRRAMLSFCEAALPNICEKSCQIFLTIGSKSVTIIKQM
jgi:hypothetical protein